MAMPRRAFLNTLNKALQDPFFLRYCIDPTSQSSKKEPTSADPASVAPRRTRAGLRTVFCQAVFPSFTCRGRVYKRITSAWVGSAADASCACQLPQAAATKIQALFRSRSARRAWCAGASVSKMAAFKKVCPRTNLLGVSFGAGYVNHSPGC